MNHSESLKSLALALSKAQACLPSAQAGKTVSVETTKGGRYSYKYADLAALLNVCRKPLADNSLAVTQLLGLTDSGHVVLHTMLLHESGEWVASESKVEPNDERSPQAMGSAITYARRYALAAIVGIGVEEDDDDGKAASARGPQPQPRREARPLSATHPPAERGQSPNEEPITSLGTFLTRATALVDTKGAKLFPTGEAVRTALGVDPGPKGNAQILTMHKTFEAALEVLRTSNTPSQGRTTAVAPPGASTGASEEDVPEEGLPF